MQTFRRVCRWLHREFGYAAVGLTLVYAVSGIAVNHAHHWDANYQRDTEISWIEPVGIGPTQEILPLVLERLALEARVKNTWRVDEKTLQVFLDNRQLDVDLITGEVVGSGFSRRPVFFNLNYMHLNSGKKGWTVIADIYAAVLVILAISGIFLVRGRKGLGGRGGVLMALGFVLPLIYVIMQK
jgi:uncharacterized protein